MCVTDDDGLNHLRERRNDERESRPSRARVQFICTVHKKGGGIRQYMMVLPGIDSVLIRTALALQRKIRGVSLLNNQMRTIVAEQLVIVEPGAVNSGDDAHRDRILDITHPLEGSTAIDTERRRTVELLFNGSWSVTGQVQHICNGCCSSVEATLVAMQFHDIDALWPRVLVVTDRKGWNGMESASCQAVLAASVHGLLPQAIIRVFGDTVSSAPVRHADALDDEIPGLVDEDDDTVPNNGRHDVGGIPVSIYKEDDKSQIAHMIRFWSTPSNLVEFFIFAGLYKQFTHATKSELHRTSKEWEELQQASFMKYGVRSNEVLEMHNCRDEYELLDSLSSMVLSDNGFICLGRGPFSEQEELRCYVHATKIGGSVYILQANKQRWFPCKYSKWMSSDVLQILRDSPCLVDLHVENLHEFYGAAGIGTPALRRRGIRRHRRGEAECIVDGKTAHPE